jgi:UDP-N-acetylmuramoyl-tripeptide--D-alanyl-D-alanine ligase
MGPVLEFLAEARAERKLLVVGTLSDYSRSASRVYSSLARRALRVADKVVFAGPQAKHALKVRADGLEERLHVFADVQEARSYLDANLRAGDLVLIKGSRTADRMDPLVPASAVPI